MAEATFSLVLHGLGPPLTFALSQDQTLRRKFEIPLYVALGVEASGGTAPRATWNGFCSVRTKPTILQNGLLSSFQRPIPSGIPPAFRVLSVWVPRVRRGSVLIRGTGRAVNADLTFFRHPSVTFPSHRISWAGKSPSPPCQLPFASPDDVPSRVVLIRAAARAVNAERTFFRLPVAAL